MSVVAYPPGWYPDPSRVHELRYFDGTSWPDHVSDGGIVKEDALPPLPPGLRAWHPPHPIAAANAVRPPTLDMPRVGMWVLAGLSFLVLWITTGTDTKVIPIGVVFAV